MKYRMMDEPVKRKSAPRSGGGVESLKVVAVLGLVGIGIYFAWAKQIGS